MTPVSSSPDGVDLSSTKLKPTDGGDSPTIRPLRIAKSRSPEAASLYKPTYSKPVFPLPPGASSSAAPLPFPDDDDDFAFCLPSVSRSYGTSSDEARLRLDTSLDEKKPGLTERRGATPKTIHSPSASENDLGSVSKSSKDPAWPGRLDPVHPYSQITMRYPAPRTASAFASASQTSRLQPWSGDSSDSVVNRFASTASNSTTKANRGSPPPPETPVVEPGFRAADETEARYAASGISENVRFNSQHGHQSQSAAATSRLAQYGTSAAPQRPWTPSESPSRAPSGPPTIYHGSGLVGGAQIGVVPNHPASAPRQSPGHQGSNVNVLEQDFQRLGAKTPPPAYSSLNQGKDQPYPSGKQRPQTQSQSPAQQHKQRVRQGSQSQTTPATANAPSTPPTMQNPAVVASPLASPALQHPGHPAFANDPGPVNTADQAAPVNPSNAGPQAPLAASPPPLPEGWIAHLDQTSGQYYYIHLASHATQWEFPKGPTPIQHDKPPLSPTSSTYGNPLKSPVLWKQSIASPLYPPQTPGYAESMMSVANSQTPTAAGFSGPPPSTGIDMYRVQPTNGVYFGPYLKYVNMDVEEGIWYGSILLVTEAPQPPTIHIHLSDDLSPNPRQLLPKIIHSHQRWAFYKYNVDLQMGEEGTERWTYAVTSHLGCTRYEFVVAGRHEIAWRFLAHSGNDFAAGTSQNERARLGGVGFMWKDVLQKNIECGGFHVQLGLGDQIYGDRLWREVPLLKQWLAMSGRENKKNVSWTARHEEDVSHAYFHFYTSHFDQPFMREAFAQIPHVLQINDHDIFDGYGSYPAYMQASTIFKNVGRIAIEMYLLFQHHTTVELMRNVSTDDDVFTITGNGWHFVKYFGPAVVVAGLDCRSERTQARVMDGPTYQGFFPKIAALPPSVQHVLWMISVPLIYPRLDALESLANTVAVGKKAVNTTYNIFGKVTSSVAGVIGGKEAVAQGFSHVKRAVGKTGLMGSVLNQFGELDIQEVLKDLWTHDTKDLERTYLIRTLQGIAQQKGIRMTFLSGDVHASGAGLVHDPGHPGDYKTMYQIISSPIVGAPQTGYVLKLLHNQKTLYVPQNGQRSTHDVSDTKEDMMEIFHTDASGATRELRRLMGRRAYVTFVAFDNESASQLPFSPAACVDGQQQQKQRQGMAKLSLAVDFVVQGDGAFQATTKYGPVIIPHLEF